MRKLYLLALVSLPLTAWIGLLAYQEFEAIGSIRAENAQIRAEIQQVDVDVQQMLDASESLPAKYARDALSDFFTRSLEAGEVLGAGVRIENRGGGEGGIQFRPLRYGLQVAQAGVQAAAERNAAPALFAMLEDEIGAMPVVIRSSEARVFQNSVTLKLEVDVFGR
jgi:hypothetical protein